MKKSAAIVILFLFAMLLWSVFADGGNMVVDIDGEHIGGPFGALIGMLFAGGGLLLGGAIVLLVGALLAVVFAGVGVIVVGALGFAAVVAALAISPLLLPLLLPLAVIGWFAGRSRRQRMVREQAV
jgi:hypothetical protein